MKLMISFQTFIKRGTDYFTSIIYVAHDCRKQHLKDERQVEEGKRHSQHLRLLASIFPSSFKCFLTLSQTSPAIVTLVN